MCLGLLVTFLRRPEAQREAQNANQKKSIQVNTSQYESILTERETRRVLPILYRSAAYRRRASNALRVYSLRASWPGSSLRQRAAVALGTGDVLCTGRAVELPYGEAGALDPPWLAFWQGLLLCLRRRMVAT
mgnify:CR=1 FL=1